jgi:ribosome-associated protein
MSEIRFTLKESFIPLIQLLKFTGVAESGSMASEMVVGEMIMCNGSVETRKRYKVKKGDIIQFEDIQIHIA